jgi:hypothetical protein
MCQRLLHKEESPHEEQQFRGGGRRSKWAATLHSHRADAAVYERPA